MHKNYKLYSTNSIPDFTEPEDFQEYFKVSRKKCGEFLFKREKIHPKRANDRITSVDERKVS